MLLGLNVNVEVYLAIADVANSKRPMLLTV